MSTYRVTLPDCFSCAWDAHTYVRPDRRVVLIRSRGNSGSHYLIHDIAPSGAVDAINLATLAEIGRWVAQGGHSAPGLTLPGRAA